MDPERVTMRDAKFQSTLSVRRATRTPLAQIIADADISIHALRKESDFAFCHGSPCEYISIHALRKESDRRSYYPRHKCCISIHALRKESDWIDCGKRKSWQYFNPRSP